MTISSTSSGNKVLKSDAINQYCDRIHATATRLRSLTQHDIQTSWDKGKPGITSTHLLESAHWMQGQPMPLNKRHHVAWPQGRQVMWLGQWLTVPEDLNGYPIKGLTLRIALTWWAEDAQIFVDGEQIQCGDLYDCSARIVLRSCANPGDIIHVAVRLVSPGHDDGALVKAVLLYENASPMASVPEPGFVADELAVLTHYLKTFDPANLEPVVRSVDTLPWDQIENREIIDNREIFNEAIAHLRHSLSAFSPWIKQRTIHLLGHAHLDLAWLWPIAETWEVAQRTFESALNLQAEYPDLIFGHSTPMLYEWMEQHRPDLFGQIQKQITAGQWEAIAGLWVEPELNLVGGESIVRQVLYGQRYCQEKFGHISHVAWLPDTFGFCWQLPQILRQGGIDYFVTQKLRWNDTTEFPHELFEWRSPDGTAITSLMSAPIGTTIDPVQMAEYACQWEGSTGSLTSLWLPGVGDHGGGPTRDMIELAHRWQQSPFFPQLDFSSAIDFLDGLPVGARVQAQAFTDPKNTGITPSNSPLVRGRTGVSPLIKRGLRGVMQDSKFQSDEFQPETALPLWTDELYLELHRGCYTAHADQKYWNRHCEALLYEAELWSSLATLITGTEYPQADIESAWKTVLFNQFHDILPGSSIPEVYEVVNPQWQEAATMGKTIVTKALGAIATHITLPPPPTEDSIAIAVFNPLNWCRSDVIAVPIPSSHEHWQVQSEDGTMLACQYQYRVEGGDDPRLLIAVPAIPGIGYRLLWLIPKKPESLEEVAIHSDTTPSSSPLPRGRTGTSPLTKGELRGVVQGVEKSNTTPSNSPASSGHAPRKLRGRTGTSTLSKGGLRGVDWVLENDRLRVAIDPHTGDIQSLVDKGCDRQVLRAPGNRLLAFRDEGEYWDAWNIAPDYLDHPLPESILKSSEWIARGPVEQRLRVVRHLGQSVFSQDYVLQVDSSMLRIETVVEWRDRHTVVKAAFPFTVAAHHATYDSPFGAIRRSVTLSDRSETYRSETPGSGQVPQPTPAEQAKWEVPGLAWADLTAESSKPDGSSSYGVSLLSDYKHGYSATPSELRLTLLRGPTWPDPESDQGHHSFCYAIYPHADSWQAARTVHHSYELRHPVRVQSLQGQPSGSTSIGLAGANSRQPELVAIASLLDIPGEHFIVCAVKRSESSEQRWLIRGYECHGQADDLPWPDNPWLPSIGTTADLLEQATSSSSDTMVLRSWGIHTWMTGAEGGHSLGIRNTSF